MRNVGVSVCLSLIKDHQNVATGIQLLIHWHMSIPRGMPLLTVVNA